MQKQSSAWRNLSLNRAGMNSAVQQLKPCRLCNGVGGRAGSKNPILLQKSHLHETNGNLRPFRDLAGARDSHCSSGLENLFNHCWISTHIDGHVHSHILARSCSDLALALMLEAWGWPAWAWRCCSVRSPLTDDESSMISSV